MCNMPDVDLRSSESKINENHSTTVKPKQAIEIRDKFSLSWAILALNTLKSDIFSLRITDFE